MPRPRLAAPDIFCFTSTKSARKYFQKYHKSEHINIPKTSNNACTYHYDIDGWYFSIIILNMKQIRKFKHSTICTFSILAHECSHAVDYWLEVLSVKHEDSELRAYMMQGMYYECLSQLNII